MRYFFIMNSGSRGGKSKRKFKQIHSLLEKTGISYQHAIVNTLNEAYFQSVKANKAGVNRIIAVGGDGTINNVINGFYNSEGHLISNAQMGVIYTGTSPDFCKSYSIPIGINNAISLLCRGNSVNIPIGRLTCVASNTNFNHAKIVRYFACCSNIGLGASIARQANNGIRNYLGDYAGTLLSIIISIVTHKANSVQAIIDGKNKEFKNLYNLSIGITKHIASGIKINHNLTNSEANFYCLATKNIRLMNILSTLRHLYSGNTIRNSATIDLTYIKHIRIDQNPVSSEIEIDGDPAGFSPCFIERASDCLPLIC